MLSHFREGAPPKNAGQALSPLISCWERCIGQFYYKTVTAERKYTNKHLAIDDFISIRDRVVEFASGEVDHNQLCRFVLKPHGYLFGVFIALQQVIQLRFAITIGMEFAILFLRSCLVTPVRLSS
jgi:hypothetical protein